MDKMDPQSDFHSIQAIGEESFETTADRAELIEAEKRKKRGKVENGESPNAESSPLHQLDNSKFSILCSPQNRGLRIIILASIIFSLAVTLALVLTITLGKKEVNGNAAVVAGDKRCAKLGIKTLKDGGNAVDAAVATAFCLSVVEPQHSGIGGGGFAIVHDHKFDKSNGYDFRETAPAAIKQEMINDNVAHTMATAGVPSMVKGLAAMHKKHGKLEWKDLIEPSIELAQEGFLVSEELENCLEEIGDDKTKSFAHFLNSDNTWKTVNDTVVLPELATTLREIRDDPDALYTGNRRSILLKDMTTLNGIITEEDLTDYKVVTPKPLEIKFKDLTVLTLPAPTAGPLVSLMLNMAKNFITKKMKRKDVTADIYHKLVETFKFGFGQMNLIGDPMFDNTVAEETKLLIGDEFALKLVKKIGNYTADDESYYGPTPQPQSGTTHISVIDSSEVMVTMSLSSGGLFGNRQFLPSTGIYLNNALMAFSQPIDDHYDRDRNKLEPKKRPQSVMCPMIVYNEEHLCDQRIVLGAVHDTNILTALVQVIINSVMFEDTFPDALSAPRLHDELNNETLYEKGFPSEIVTELIKMGHNMTLISTSDSHVTGIRKVNDDIKAGIDPRSLSAEDHY